MSSTVPFVCVEEDMLLCVLARRQTGLSAHTGRLCVTCKVSYVMLLSD
jgi:hypothetical protein